MIRALVLALLLLPAPAFCQAPVPSLGDLSASFEMLSEKVSPAVVQIVASGYLPAIESDQQNANVTRQLSGGSGVILEANGYILTNAHVIEGATRLQVMLAQRVGPAGPRQSALKPSARFHEARVVGVDVETDLAVLKIDREDLPTLRLADSDELRQGQLVLAFGSPLGLANTVTMGVVSSVARQLERDSPMIYIQTDASINPGNSGGPLVDAAGDVVGINTLIFSQSGGAEGVGFAAPSNICRTVFEHLKTVGYVPRGEIGVTAQTITPELASSLDLPQDWGVLLGDVRPGGSGEISGLEIGDIVLTLDGKPMENSRQFRVNLYHRSTAEIVRLGILRGEEALEIRVVVIEKEYKSEKLALLVERSQHLVPNLGVLAVGLNRKIRPLLPKARKTTGVVVAALVVDGPRRRSPLLPGDIIHSVNGEATPALTHLQSAIGQIDPDQPAALHIERGGEFRYVVLQPE